MKIQQFLSTWFSIIIASNYLAHDKTSSALLWIILALAVLTHKIKS